MTGKKTVATSVVWITVIGMYDTLLNISKHRCGDGKAKFYLFQSSEKKADNVITSLPLHSNFPLKRVNFPEV